MSPDLGLLLVLLFGTVLLVTLVGLYCYFFPGYRELNHLQENRLQTFIRQTKRWLCLKLRR